MSEEYRIDQDRAEPISRLGRNYRPASGDLYAVSRISGSQASYKVDYKDVLTRTVQEISAGFGFKSMAFCGRQGFAEFDHMHGYSYVACYPAPSSDPSQSCIMTLSIADASGSRQVSVFSPPLPPPLPEREPSIGEVRFLALSGISEQYDATWTGNSYSLKNPHTGIMGAIAVGTFDGWTYPDGSEYLKDFGPYDFSRAYQLYGGSGGKFSVPVLSSFFRPNPGAETVDAMRHVPAQMGIRQHSHAIQTGRALASSVTVSGTVTMDSVSKGGSDTNYVHRAKTVKGRLQYISGDVDCQLDLGNATIMYEGEPGDETYPSHQLIPVQIYIGRDMRS